MSSSVEWSARRVAVAVWVAVSLIQFVIWAMIGILGGGFVEPWFLWTVGVGGVIVGVVHLVTGSEKSA
ncbi:hypothetical protein [Pseudonocardia sp. TRM90224]|uniref:hypothetical protein n=1 Tax=Pseudonocardia sp. TRM90224 TaxID=2812678 RepID=UPI001E28CD9B|nr:hypothetical protein [Pseudonocardia sp. TRM90224]